MRKYEHGPNLVTTSESLPESFGKKRNEKRAESLQKFLPPSVGKQRLLDFLGGKTVSLVKQRMKEFPLILGGTEIELLGKNLRSQIRSALIQHLGDNSYLRNDGGDLSDESEFLTVEMYAEQAALQKAYWHDYSALLNDNLGLLRMNVLSYKVLGEPAGSISDVIQKMLEKDIEKRLAELEKELRETPDWLARKGLPEEGSKSNNDLSKRIDEVVLSFKKDKVEELINAGVHHKIAKARVLSDSTKPKELTPENIAYIEKRLKKMRKDFPQLQQEYERFKQSINDVVRELLNEPSLDHIIQIHMFSIKK